MANYSLYIATSLDGYIARLDGRIDWLPVPEEGGDDYGYQEFYDSVDAIVMGAVTYEQVLEFGEWPYPGKVTYVVSGRSHASFRDDVVMVTGGIAELLLTIRDKNYSRVWIVGGGKLASALMQAGVVSDYQIAIIPVILGEGIPLYDSVPEQNLTLLDVRAYPDGVVSLHYRNQTEAHPSQPGC